jgi:3-hydroxybutyryl-CoA dehydratase
MLRVQRVLCFASTNGSLHRALHSVGNAFELQKRFSAADVENFVNLTEDRNPIHAGPTDPVIVPGMLLASMFPAIIGSRFPGALYLKQSLSFRSPASVDQLIYAMVTVTRATGSRVQFNTVCRSADGTVLVDGTALALMPNH